MAGPERDPGENSGKPTGTRPKSRSNTNSSTSYRGSFSSTGGGHQALVNLMREYQAVNDSLAAAREQIEREGGQSLLRERWGEGTSNRQRMARPAVGVGVPHRNSANDEKVRELEMLRSRMQELEAELSSSRDVNTDDTSNSGQSFNISMECDSSEEMERNLALLTAQYEKTSQDEDSLHFSPGHIMVNNSLDIEKSNDGEVMPPAMSLLNNSSDTVKLARELRHKRDQLEELMKKNVMTTSVNESNYAGRNKINNRSWCEVTNPGQELYKLGDQVTRLKEELERLSQPLPSSNDSQSQSQTSQLAQLSVSVNQLYSGLWALQRDVSQISERLAAVENNERRASPPSPVSQPEPPQPPVWDSHHHFSPFPSTELWNSLQASPGFNNPLHLGAAGMFPPNFHISETDSGVSSGALNNQPGVSPGVRANNYYDNFRSFSRQNRLAGSSQQSPQSSEPANNANNGSVRPRRKYKINREHNKDSGAQSNLRRRTEGANPVLAANTFTSPGTESLTNNIYSQVGALIQQHDRAPELLARLLQDLTLLGQQESRNMNLDLDSSSFTSEETRDRDRESDTVRQLQSRSKVAGKRLTSGPQSGFSPSSGWAPAWSPGLGAVAVPKNQQKNLISRERDSRRTAGWRERVLPRNMQDREEGEQEGFINIQLELPEDSQEQEVSDQAETEELAEADQSQEMTQHRDIWAQHQEDREPEGVFPVRDSHRHHGLDRVPIRLPSTTANSTNWPEMSQATSERIEARRLEENEAVASIVEEVLASSPELANNQEADTPHLP